MDLFDFFDYNKDNKFFKEETKMAIKESSFRIGCGRYVQAPKLIDTAGTEIARIGRYPLVVGDSTALAVVSPHLEKSIRESCEKYTFITHNGTCNDTDAQKIASVAKESGNDVIVGVGGGVIMDFSKLCGHFATLPVVNIPTSSATCAAYTPLSVRYTPEGRTVGSMHYGYEVAGVICDTEIMLRQPVRLFLAGVFDALAKFVEIKQRYDESLTDYEIGLDYAYVMAKRSYKVLTEKVLSALSAMEKGEMTRDFEQVVFTTIAATGVISGIARGSNQCAIAHKFYETTRYFYPEKARPYLHGEIVGVGLLLQNHFNDEAENNDSLLALMDKYSMPKSIQEVGIDATDEMFLKFYEKICSSSAVDGNNEKECEKFKKSLKYLWEMK